MNAKKLPTNVQFQLCGWYLFIGSALFFIASSYRAGDILSLTGGLLFLIACVVFIIPLLSKTNPVDSPVADSNDS